MSEELLAEAARLLTERSGVTVPPYRRELLRSELERLGAGALARGLEVLRAGDQRSFEQLACAFAVGETYLFRGPEHYRELRRLAQGRAARGLPMTVLCAGVSTGEEAWSAAMVVADVHEPPRLPFHVVGWDLSRERLARAELGRFGLWSVRNGVMGYERYLVRTEAGFEIVPRLRRHVQFEHVNLTGPLPEPPRLFDAIFFRNVSMYWRPEQANAVVAALAERLSAEGSLLIGPTDPVEMSSERWSVETVGTCFIYRRRSRPAPTPEPRPRPRPKLALVSSTSALVLSEPRQPPPTREPVLTLDSVGLVELVRELADQGDYERALSLLEGHEVLSPELLELRGILHLNLGEHDEAIERFRAACYWDANNPIYARWLDLAIAARDRSREAATLTKTAPE